MSGDHNAHQKSTSYLDSPEVQSVVGEIIEMLEAMHDHDKDRHNYYLIAANLVRNNFGEHDGQ